MRKLIISFLLTCSIIFPVEAKEYAQNMYVTCYCPESCPGTITYTGEHVREGIAAVIEDRIGMMADVYSTNGEYIGTYECLDKIGTGKKTVIDIWKPNLESAKALMAKTQGRVVVYFYSKGERI